MFDPIVAYLFESSNVLLQELNYIRSEMHEEQQRLDRASIDRAEAWERAIQKDIDRRDADEEEENERQYREQMERLELWGDPRLSDEPANVWPDVPNPSHEWTPRREGGVN